MANTNIKPRGAIASNLPPVAPVTLHGLQFPRGGDAPTTDYVAIQFANPHLNGLPIWGPSNAGVTIVRRIKLRTQTADGSGHYYYAQFWWSNGEVGTGWLWNAGVSDTNYGFHPWPPTNSSAAWYWEIAVQGTDIYNNRGGGNTVPTMDLWYTQGMRITRNANATKTVIFYLDLPSTTNANVIEQTTPSGYGETNPPAPMLTIGDSPWTDGTSRERASCIHGPIKIFDKVLSEADMLSEAADFTQLTTSDGASHIWWGKTNFTTIDDLTCNYGTGRSFVWFDSSKKATLVDI